MPRANRSHGPNPIPGPGKKEGVELHRAQPRLGTLVSVSAHGPSRSAVEKTLSAAFERIGRWEDLWSAFQPESDVQRLNRQSVGIPLALHPATHALLKTLDHWHRLSEGRIDITAGAGPSPACAADLILLKSPLVVKKRPLQVDLGGVAKGHIVDKTIEFLQLHRMTAGGVNAGGDLRFFGPTYRPVFRRPWNGRGEPRCLGWARAAAVATSAPTYTGTVHHPHRLAVVNPKTGRPAHTRGVTVIGPCALEADAFTKWATLAPGQARRALPTLGYQLIWDTP